MLKEQDAAKQTSADQDTSDSKDAKEESEPKITCVGDSVMLGAAPELMQAIPDGVIDAKESRQARDGVEILEGLKEENKLGSTVAIELGTNCYFSQATGQEIIDYLGKRYQDLLGHGLWQVFAGSRADKRCDPPVGKGQQKCGSHCLGCLRGREPGLVL